MAHPQNIYIYLEEQSDFGDIGAKSKVQIILYGVKDKNFLTLE